jgi:outer membrane protein TolC
MIFRKRLPIAAAVAFSLWLGHLPCRAQEPPPGVASPSAGSRGESASGGNDNAARAGILWNMDNVVAIALSRHPLIGQADAETTAAIARKGQAESGYYPSISLSTGYTRSRTFSSTTDQNATGSSLFVEGAVSQILSDFGRTRAGANRAGSLVSAAAESGKSTRQDVAFAAKIAYFGVLRAHRIVDVRRETLTQRESLLSQAQDFYQAGVRARIDVARTEANLYQARAEMTAARNDLQVSRITLLNRMGIDGPTDFRLDDTLAVVTVPGDLDSWIAEAEADRPELRAIRERERAAEFGLRAARANYFPVLTGAGGYGYAAEDLPLEQNYYNISVLLQFPLFSGFLTREEVKESQASLDSTRYAATDLRRLVRLEVERAALSVREASERFEARRKEQEASGENLRLARERYKVGAGDIIEMIDAQVQMTRAETAVIEALYDSSISAATLLRAVGR